MKQAQPLNSQAPQGLRVAPSLQRPSSDFWHYGFILETPRLGSGRASPPPFPINLFLIIQFSEAAGPRAAPIPSIFPLGGFLGEAQPLDLTVPPVHLALLQVSSLLPPAQYLHKPC